MTQDELLVNELMSVVKDVRSYFLFTQYRKIVDIGLNDLPFEKVMIYSWIAEEINDR